VNLAESFEIKPVSEKGLAAEINVRLDNECDQAIARDDERDWSSSARIMATR